MAGFKENFRVSYGRARRDRTPHTKAEVVGSLIGLGIMSAVDWFGRTSVVVLTLKVWGIL